jgi:hypothetical protein
MGALVVALLLSGLFVGVSHGSTDAAPVRLAYGDLFAEHQYPLRDKGGRHSGTLEVFKGELLDEEGSRVGHHRCECVDARSVGWWCTHILTIHDGPYTREGSVVITGLFHGFDGEQLAIVGGTGAYAAATGYAVASVDGDEFLNTLYVTS